MSLAISAPLSVVIWSLVLVAVVFVGYVLVAWVRRRVRQSDQPETVGFSLADLRRLHREGQLSDEEYERARSKLLAALKRQEEKKT